MIELKNAEPIKNSKLESEKKIEIEQNNNYLDSKISGHYNFIEKIEKEKDTEFISEDKPVPPYKHIKLFSKRNKISDEILPNVHQRNEIHCNFFKTEYLELPKAISDLSTKETKQKEFFTIKDNLLKLPFENITPKEKKSITKNLLYLNNKDEKLFSVKIYNSEKKFSLINQENFENENMRIIKSTNNVLSFEDIMLRKIKKYDSNKILHSNLKINSLTKSDSEELDSNEKWIKSNKPECLALRKQIDLFQKKITSRYNCRLTKNRTCFSNEKSC